MNIIKNLAFTALAASLLIQASNARADDHAQQGDPGQGDATVSFTKWRTALNPRPGVVADMAGVIAGGDVGDGEFTGEILSSGVVNGVIVVEADYHLQGSKHSFTARVHAEQRVAGIGQKGVITGVVTDGWLKGHTVQGEWTVIPPCGDISENQNLGNCFEVALDIVKGHPSSRDEDQGPPVPFKATFHGFAEPATPTTDPDVFQIVIPLQGTATHLGTFDELLVHYINFSTGAFTGYADWTAASGDTFTTVFHGQLYPTDDPAWLTFDVSHAVVAGTGRFKGATGSFNGVNGLFNLVTGEDLGGYLGTFSY